MGCRFEPTDRATSQKQANDSQRKEGETHTESVPSGRPWRREHRHRGSRTHDGDRSVVSVLDCLDGVADVGPFRGGRRGGGVLGHRERAGEEKKGWVSDEKEDGPTTRSSVSCAEPVGVVRELRGAGGRDGLKTACLASAAPTGLRHWARQVHFPNLVAEKTTSSSRSTVEKKSTDVR